MGEVPGMHGLVISDLDGVPVLQATCPAIASTAAAAQATEACMRYQFNSAQSVVDEKVACLGLDKAKKSLAVYDDQQVLSVTQDRLRLTLIAGADANTGLLENFAKRLQPLVRDVSTAVVST